MVSGSPSMLHSSSLQLLQTSTMAGSVAPKRLKIKLSKLSTESGVVSAELERSSQVLTSVREQVSLTHSGSNSTGGVTGVSYSHDLKARFSLNSGSGLTTASGIEKRITNNNKLKKNTGDYPDGELVVSERYNVHITVSHAGKRGPVISLDNQKAKKQKIDSRVMPQCVALLKKLMSQTYSFIFNKPVDPVELNIPDYFKVISEPMDLGTIKSKLEKKLYPNLGEFAADVRLTFSNAMHYNPPSNEVHILAKRLSDIFESRWKSLDAKWSAPGLKVGQQTNSNERQNKTLDFRQDAQRTQASRPQVSKKVLVTPAQRHQLRRDLMEISKRKVPPTLLDRLRKLGLVGQNDDRIEADIDAFGETAVCELQNVIRSYHQFRSAESAHTQYSCGRDSLQKDLHKGNGSTLAFGSSSDKSQTSSACINSSCGSMHCKCSLHNALPTDSHRPSGGENNSGSHVGAHRLDLLVNNTSSRQTIKSDPDSDGGVSTVDEENVDPCSHPQTPGTASACEEGWGSNTYDEQLSPSKALRAAMLRTRFADTIVKAQQKTLLNNGEKSDPVKLKREKERLEKQQREERARIEAKIRAAETASRNREKMELKEQREREREAARIAVQKMERTVQINENMEILKDLEMLGGFSQPDYFLLHKDNPLERLGLFIKDDYLEEEELEICILGVEEELKNCTWDVEEGEHCKGNIEEEVKHCKGDAEEEVENFNGDVEEGEIA